jgi:queuosine precursor transporter
MPNEIIFLLQIIAVGLSVVGARRLGKEALITLAVLLAVFANFFVLKQITLFSWTVTCSDAYVIGHLMCLNLLQQIGSKKMAQKAVVLSFSAMLLFALFSQIHLMFYPSSFDTAHRHYEAVLTAAPRLLAASLVTFYAVQQLDLFLFGKILKIFPTFSWRIRSALSLFISQGFDTLLFTLLGLYGVVEDWVSIFWMSFGIKCSVILAMSVAWPEQKGKSYEI